LPPRNPLAAGAGPPTRGQIGHTYRRVAAGGLV